MTPTRASDFRQTLLWTGVGLALLALFYMLSPILAPFAIAAVLAYICDPAVNWLVGHRVPRPLAVLLVILGIGLLVLMLAGILAPMIYSETATLITRLPDLLDHFNTSVAPWLARRFDLHIQLDAAFVRELINQHSAGAQNLIPILLAHARSGGMALISLLVNLFLIPIVMFYLLQEWPRLMNGLRDIVPRPWLAPGMRIARSIDSVLSEFLRGQLSVMLLLAVFYSVGLWLAGLNFALPVGVITGLMSFIPYVGFGGGLVLAILAALLQGDGWSPLIGVAVVYGLGQLIESYLLTPYIVGERIGLHPLAVIFALMAFGQLFGFVGMLVALPVSAALLVALRELKAAWLASRIYRGELDGKDHQ
ncbi:AI-2E family transporter [Pseudothauera nasutitermitis]|uniref:AI-2E family transporter n=1 Tax=Pseudothauera nasutitermitis TaxID=2565930 RepID=A0A4S4AP74_9RHOO|nr:AI-2E family transporter [Pseudothauera nasutitermitis]THF61469.1 AI-2E family transporter [Pseudothauera nasutitermitis]